MSMDGQSLPKWRHEETDPFGTTEFALTIASTGAWGGVPRTEAVRYLRTLVLLSLQVGRISNDPPPPHEEGLPTYGHYEAITYANEFDLWAASTVLRTLVLLVPHKAPIPYPFSTKDGSPPVATPIVTKPAEAGAAPAVPVALVVVGIVVASIAAVVIAHEAATVVDRHLERTESTRRMMQAQSAAIQIISDHAAAEKAAGRSLPWSSQENAVLGNLLGIQQELAKERQIPLPAPFDGAIEKIGGGLGKIGEGIGGAAKEAVSLAAWLVPALAVSAVALLYITSGSKASQESAPPPPPRSEPDKGLEGEAVAVRALPPARV